MGFAPIKSGEQQSILMLHRSRELLVRGKTMLLNALRGRHKKMSLWRVWHCCASSGEPGLGTGCNNRR
jgi:hypothetical protein